MDETTPLFGDVPPVYADDAQLSKRTKALLYSVTTFVAIASLYLFVIFLPGYYIPQAEKLKEITRITELGASLIPVPHKGEIERLIMVGDIHGHYTEFEELLNKVEYNAEKGDHLLVLGDFITKGPDSLKVLDYLIDHDVDCIMGNHEFYVLQFYATFHRLDQPTFYYNFSDSQPQFQLKKNIQNDPEFRLARRLQPAHVRYINNCSIIKKLGHVPLKGNKLAPGVAVHAGLRWDLSLADQNPIDNIEMRALMAPYYNVTTPDPDFPNSEKWHRVYNEQQGKPFANFVVYYGHAASQGLKLRKYTKGLDSACDKGGKLSAMVISRRKTRDNDEYELMQEIVQVNC
ncbi:hypothetical protein KGF56_000725 [Candida oxycetoniae]|uniref:Calcineurin-like phosphoesterase domain-containing protein n=1 Tax=Candida oxycetoniae TaxID=497107 RepID=A0AAI9WZV0_9ASCO|nr:uncharacterized protein KGF56_000725 [Candida oxycetoniae]KAI3406593.1 hypothetical protein KGF56_000725 [Candida oxycetoniae]